MEKRLFITNPLAGRNLMNFFATHPPIEKRVARLRGTKIVRSDNSDDSGPTSGSTMSDQARSFWDNLS